jgi:hypothetical protein
MAASAQLLSAPGAQQVQAVQDEAQAVQDEAQAVRAQQAQEVQAGELR